MPLKQAVELLEKSGGEMTIAQFVEFAARQTGMSECQVREEVLHPLLAENLASVQPDWRIKLLPPATQQ
ncbi:MAG: hypothetical protein R3B52_02720 [Candidatus Paceibacterota bacterium]